MSGGNGVMPDLETTGARKLAARRAGRARLAGMIAGAIATVSASVAGAVVKARSEAHEQAKAVTELRLSQHDQELHQVLDRLDDVNTRLSRIEGALLLPQLGVHPLPAAVPPPRP